jgi:hypothetical protein
VNGPAYGAYLVSGILNGPKAGLSGRGAGLRDIHSCAMTVEDLHLAARAVVYVAFGQ